MDDQQRAPRRDWFRIVAIVTLVLGGLAMLGGLALILAAFVLVGA